MELTNRTFAIPTMRQFFEFSFEMEEEIALIKEELPDEFVIYESDKLFDDEIFVAHKYELESYTVKDKSIIVGYKPIEHTRLI